MSISDIFIDRYPTLDLHGYEAAITELAINDFIRDNIKLKNDIIVIIHGIGSGVLREITNNTLRKNKNALEYHSSYNNRGCTIVRLKI